MPTTTTIKVRQKGDPTDGTGIYTKKGYICDWYQAWFEENDVIYAKDKELAFALQCSQSAFTNARSKMKEKGYEIEAQNGAWVVTARPMSEDRKQEIEDLTDYLINLGDEVEKAKTRLEELTA